MRKRFFIILIAVIMVLGMFPVTAAAEESGEIPVDADHFEDETFRNYVSENFDTDHNGSLSAGEIAAVTSIALRYEGITSLEGIEYFTALTFLECSMNFEELTSLDLSHNTALTYLDLSNNRLTSLDLSHNTALTYLNVYGNKMTSLDLSHNTALVDLDCSGTNLTSLDLSHNAALTTLNCSENPLGSLDVSGNAALVLLWCERDGLETLDVSSNTALQQLYCDDNSLSTLNLGVNQAMTTLDCADNQLTELDLRGTPHIRDYVLEGKYWQDNGDHLAVDPGVTLILDPAIYFVTVTNDGNGTASASPAYGEEGTEVTLTAAPNEGYHFREWEVVSGGVEITDDAFVIGTENVEIRAIFEAHDEVTDPAVAPTCTETGLTEGSHCSVCGEVITTQETVDALGHEWGEWEVTTEPGVGTPGERQSVCSRCGEVRTEAIPALIGYTVISGADGSWTPGSGESFELTVKRSEADETCFSHFTSVTIDGTELTQGTDYTARAGSTVITIPAETLEKLTVGAHTVTVNFDDGSVTATLNVKAAASGGGTSPLTADSSHAILWIGLMAASLAAAGGVTAYSRKKK